MVAARSEAADPMLRRARSDVAHQRRPLGGSRRKRSERLERERGHVIRELQRDHAGPGNAEVEAIVGLTARTLGRVVAGTWRKADMPVARGGDLRRVRLVAADEPSEQRARSGGDADRQQEMPHHRHPIAAQDEALDVVEVQRTRRRVAGLWGLAPACPNRPWSRLSPRARAAACPVLSWLTAVLLHRPGSCVRPRLGH